MRAHQLSRADPSHYRIDDAMLTAAAMGAGVIRGHTLGISTGNVLSYEPSLEVMRRPRPAPVGIV